MPLQWSAKVLHYDDDDQLVIDYFRVCDNYNQMIACDEQRTGVLSALILSPVHYI